MHHFTLYLLAHINCILSYNVPFNMSIGLWILCIILINIWIKNIFRNKYMYILIKNLFYVHICRKCFFKTIYQERLALYYFKNNIKKVPQNEENAYLAIKSQDPCLFWLTSFMLFCCISLAETYKKIGALLTKSQICPHFIYN